MKLYHGPKWAQIGDSQNWEWNTAGSDLGTPDFKWARSDNFSPEVNKMIQKENVQYLTIFDAVPVRIYFRVSFWNLLLTL